MKVELITPQGVLRQGEFTAAVAPGADGELGILSHHAPMVAALGKGVLRLAAGAQSEGWRLEGGFLLVEANHLRVIAEKADKAG